MEKIRIRMKFFIFIIFINYFILVISMLLLASIPSFATLFETSERVMSFNIFCLPKIIEGVWDLVNKLGFSLNFNDCWRVVYAISMAFLLLMVKNNEKDIPASYTKVMNMIFKDIN